jgi:hypothetical protein
LKTGQDRVSRERHRDSMGIYDQEKFDWFVKNGGGWLNMRSLNWELLGVNVDFRSKELWIVVLHEFHHQKKLGM